MNQNDKILELVDIRKTFGKDEVLRGISLDLYKGQVISVLGSSGSGKSTFLRCINLLEKPDSGRIFLHQQELDIHNQKALQAYRTKVGMVFQSFNLWSHMTIIQNIMEAPVHVLGISREKARQEAEVLLDKVGLLSKQDMYPAQLSGGQQQRVAIARTLAMNPEVILFDEPTSALDPELVHGVLEVMQDLAKEGMTMIVVTHEMDFARNVSDEILFFHQGLIEEKGSPDKLFNSPESERFKQFIQHIR